MPDGPALEVAVDDAADAALALTSGAHRIELCAALEVGGVTPGPGLLLEARAEVDGELVVLCRPRRGDFVYDASAFRALLRDVDAARAAGADGVALGVLLADGRLDVPRVEELVAAAGPLTVTLHRAFDQAPEPLAALEELVGLGVRRVLTSGAAPSAREGALALRALVERAGARIEVVVAGGVRSEHAAALAREVGAQAYHASASRLLRGAARGPSLAPSRLPAEHERRAVDPEEVAALARALGR